MMRKKTALFGISCAIGLLCLLFFACSKRTMRIGIISDARYCGERELAWRIKIAAENLGWHVFLDEKRGRKLKKIARLDWIICLLPNNKHCYTNCPNYLAIFHPFHYLDAQGQLDPFYDKYDGYLLTIPRTKALEEGFAIKNKPLFSIPFYPTMHSVNYKKVALNNLVTMIPVWSNRISEEKFKTVYKALSQSGFTKFFGIHARKDIIEQGYMGKIPFDGTSVIDILQQHGIVLIFHSDIHNRDNLPSSRIFEAAAASTVIISDNNGFVRQHFGDSVFYVDTSVSAEDIYCQIKQHMDTIQMHPEIALEMAKKAHDIFTERFLMTNQLLQICDMHNKVRELQNSRCCTISEQHQ